MGFSGTGGGEGAYSGRPPGGGRERAIKIGWFTFWIPSTEKQNARNESTRPADDVLGEKKPFARTENSVFTALGNRAVARLYN